MAKGTWRIFCPGPSLDRATYRVSRDGSWRNDRSIAVNGAILTVPCRYWAVMDYHVVPSIVRLGHDSTSFLSGIKLWCPRSLVTETRKYQPDSLEILNVLDKAFFPEEPYPPELTGIDPEFLWNSFTLMAAIGKALVEEATDIWIYGADMGGSGYFDTRLNTVHDTHSEERWGEEQRIYRIVEKFCFERGVTIRRELDGHS